MSADEPQFERFDLPSGKEGLATVAANIMSDLGDPVMEALIKAVCMGYALGYHDGAEGKPAIVPAMVIPKGDLPE